MGTTTKILLLIFVAIVLTHSESFKNSNPSDGNVSASPSLSRAHSSDTLEADFKAALIERYTSHDYFGNGGFILASGDAELVDTSSSFSTTTTQERHVDESDRIKTDGKFIFTSLVKSPGIKIFRAENGYAPVASELSINTHSPENPLTGLYLRPNKQQLIALAGGAQQSGDGWFSVDYWNNRRTELFTIDIRDAYQPQQRNKLSLDGQLVSSRRIGSTLYLVTRHTATIPGLIEYPENYHHTLYNRALIATTSLDEMLPKYQIDEKQYPLFEADDCFYTGKGAAAYSQQSIISLVAIDLDAAEPVPTAQCFVGNAETLYASSTAIYIATTQYPYHDDDYEIVYKNSTSTEIHKFALDGTQAGYVGSASVAGHLGWQQSHKPFRMSEDNGVLRVLTYVGDESGSVKSPARLHTLQEGENFQLDLLASLPNEQRPEPLGKPGEHIYASRFIGERGYLVTFRATDPLYILDISNPRDPYIMSALEIDGFSDYLHPVGEDYLLGIGKDAIPEELVEGEFNAPRGAWYQGVKLSLINISNPLAPFEQQKIILGKRGTETAVSVSHHALTALQRGQTLHVNLPMTLHEKPVNHYGSAPHPSDHFGWTQDALYRLNIDTKTGVISMKEPIVAVIDEIPEYADYFFDTGWQRDRSVIIDNTTYYLKGDRIFAASEALEAQ